MSRLKYSTNWQMFFSSFMRLPRLYIILFSRCFSQSGVFLDIANNKSCMSIFSNMKKNKTNLHDELISDIHRQVI